MNFHINTRKSWTITWKEKLFCCSTEKIKNEDGIRILLQETENMYLFKFTLNSGSNFNYNNPKII